MAESDLERGEIFGVPAALIVLLIVFGAVLAAAMPLVLSVISIVLAVALTGLIGQVYPMSTFVLNMLTMMGLAVGIDYTLFVISRYREERARGLDKLDAIAATGATANRAIFFSGMTVVVAMVGMVMVPFDITIGMGLGVMLVVFTTLLTALIMLPGVMGLLGDRVNALRLPVLGRKLKAGAPRREGVGEKLAHSIMRRPVVWLTVAVTGLLARRRPCSHAHRQQHDERHLHAGRPVRQAGLGHPRPRVLPGQGEPVADRDRRAGPRPEGRPGARQAGRGRAEGRPLWPFAGGDQQVRRPRPGVHAHLRRPGRG